jgi:cell division GTPase FtsZ
MNADQQFKNYVRKAFEESPELAAQASKMVLDAKSSKGKMVLDDKTVRFIMADNGISMVQANDLWAKSLSFNDILITKYGDTYFENTDLIMRLTKKYQRALVEKYKASK